MTEIRSVQYNTKTHAPEGRTPPLAATRLDIRLTVPVTIGMGNNPEQLLSAGWSAYLISGMVLAVHKS